MDDLGADLHSHSTASDGTLTPAALIETARREGLRLLALTDHDTTDGLEEALAAARGCGVQLIPGIELSADWRGRVVHVTGLGIDPGEPALRRGLDATRQLRARRAEEIGRRLHKAGFAGALAGARRLAGAAVVTRTHFARHLVEQGHFASVSAVFRDYLRPGKPGYAGAPWTDLTQAVAWIRGAGGIPVLAHLMRYRLTGARRRRLLADFKGAGGEAMEVVCGGYGPVQVRDSAAYAVRYDLAGAAGSDFHGPGRPWQRLGHLARIPAPVSPLPERW